MLLDLMPMDILNAIEICLVRLEHHVKLKGVVTRINIPYNNVLRMATYQDWDHLMNSGNLLLYHMIRYKQSYRNYIKITCGLGTNTYLVKHKHI